VAYTGGYRSTKHTIFARIPTYIDRNRPKMYFVTHLVYTKFPSNLFAFVEIAPQNGKFSARLIFNVHIYVTTISYITEEKITIVKIIIEH